MKKLIHLALFILTAATCSFAAESKRVAPRPPMGWNSYDAYHGVITEWQFRSAVDVLAEKMLPHGYDYAVVDFLWYHPGPPGWDALNHWKTWDVYQSRDTNTSLLMPQLITDAYGRPLPATNRFPSATNGQGLKPIGDYVHSKGMKFGLHIMRGIPTQSVEANLPVLGTSYRMQEIAEAGDVSSLCRGMFTGVNVDHPGAQAYYDGLFKMFAEWGVDFIKADDMMRPPYHAREIELMRRAIDKSGRPMVFSLSYGEAPVSQAAHLVRNADMWRVSADFWDRWTDLRRSFDLMYWWSPFIGESTWPDADMIPIGRLMLSGWKKTGAENVNSDKSRVEREDKFTPDERQTLMTLWCIARSPLMWGGDPLSSGTNTFALLTNDEVLAVNQHGRNPRQVVGNSHKDDTLRVWVSAAPDGGRYVALFNLREEEATVTLDLTWEEMRGTWTVRNLWTHAAEAPVTGKLSRKLSPHASALFKLTREP